MINELKLKRRSNRTRILRGGRRLRKPPQFGEFALLSAIIHYYGGPTKAAKLIGVDAAVCINFRNRGLVSADLIAKAAKAWHVHPLILNYKRAIQTHTGVIPSWAQLVNTVVYLPKSVRDDIMKLPRKFGVI